MQYLTLKQIEESEDYPTVTARTAGRWMREGATVHGQQVKLRAARMGRYLCTTRQWLDEFFEAVANVRHAHSSPVSNWRSNESEVASSSLNPGPHLSVLD